MGRKIGRKIGKKIERKLYGKKEREIERRRIKNFMMNINECPEGKIEAFAEVRETGSLGTLDSRDKRVG